MQLVERHVVLDGIYEEICRKSGLQLGDLLLPTGDIRCSRLGNTNYQGCVRHMRKKITKRYLHKVRNKSQVFQAFRSWRAARKAYEKEPSKFKGRPKMPTYKTGKKQNIITFTNQNARLKNGSIHFPKNAGLKPIQTKVQNFQQVRIVPQATCHIVEIVYEQPVIALNLNPSNVLSIDLGLNNYATCVNNVGKSPFLINGRIMKSSLVQ